MKNFTPFRFECAENEEGVSCSFLLDIDDDIISEYESMFASREEEGFEGNGYDWEAIAVVYLNECAPELIPLLDFDSEAGMFCVYGEEEPLTRFAEGFSEVAKDRDRLADLFSRAECI